MNQFRRVGWMTMWAATVLAFVLSFHEPAATYAMALRPASDTRNYLDLPWSVPEARKWTLVVAGVAFVAIILIAGAQSLLVRRWVSPRRWLAVTVVGAAGAIVVDSSSYAPGRVRRRLDASTPVSRPAPSCCSARSSSHFLAMPAAGPGLRRR